jgi:hypothetical protein
MIERDSICAEGSSLTRGPVRNDGMRRVGIWRRALILAGVLSLTINVATRYTAVVQHSAAAKIVSPHSVDAKRQHLLNNGLHWSAPAATFVLLQPAGALTSALPSVPRVTRLDSEDFLYSRPPPSFC